MHTYFISDLHLTPERPQISHAFLRFLQEQALSAQRLYILGDLFEYWIGDDAAALIGAEPIIAAMRQTAGKIPCYFIAGNRDFLIGEQFSKESGFEILVDETVIDLYGQPTLILHGDSLCTQDTAHMMFREAMVNNAAWKADFLENDIPQRIELAKMARSESQQHKASVSMEIMDVSESAVIDAFENHAVKQMIHGHTHRQNIHQHPLSDQTSIAMRYVLNDWNTTSSVLKADQSGIEIHNFAID